MHENAQQQWSSGDIVKQYMTYFRERNHLPIAGGPIVAPGSGGTSFTIAGMQPLVAYLRGQERPPSPRLTGWQRCLRTDDADAVGTNGRKLTSFHMLGNWSIGDYGKREAIALAWELMIERFSLDPARLWVTTFAGDGSLGLAPDRASVTEWRGAGIPAEHIVPLGAQDNLWTMGGPGPCGPSTEIFVDRGVDPACREPLCRPGCACERFLEIWGLVFLEFERRPDDEYIPLPVRSVDTGMGLERVAAVLQRVDSVFEIDLFGPASARLAEIAPAGSGGGGPTERRARRMITDHARAALFAGLDGVEPGRDGRKSVVRRLIRRAARQGRILGIHGPFLGELIVPLVEAHGALLRPEEREHVPALRRSVTEEEARFARVLTAGLKHLERLEPDERGVVAGEQVFALHADRGFPPDLAVEILAERGLAVDCSGYDRALAAHREVSRVSAARHFGGA